MRFSEILQKSAYTIGAPFNRVYVRRYHGTIASWYHFTMVQSYHGTTSMFYKVHMEYLPCQGGQNTYATLNFLKHQCIKNPIY